MLKFLSVLALLGLCYGTTSHGVDRVRQDFTDKLNLAIVQQIQNELRASYMYQAYSHYFGRADVALPGFAKWFEKASLEERQHATGLIEYLNKRGGQAQLSDLQFSGMCTTVGEVLKTNLTEFGRTEACICVFMSPKAEQSCGERKTWKNGLWAMQDTLALEKYVNKALLKLRADADNDPHLSHVLEHDYLDEQVEAIKTIGDYIRKLERVGEGVGLYLFDKDL